MATVEIKEKNTLHFATFVKGERLKKDLSLRKICKALKLDPSNWSKVERGKLPPPQEEAILNSIGELLELTEEDTGKLKDYACLDKGLIPPDILSNEELSKSLPLFFRTLRNEKPTTEELRKEIGALLLNEKTAEGMEKRISSLTFERKHWQDKYIRIEKDLKFFKGTVKFLSDRLEDLE